MKGLEIGTGKRLTAVMEEELGPDIRTLVWVGPGHVQDFLAGMPNCMVMASKNMELTKQIATIFNSRLIRFYYGRDLLGIEIGAAAKMSLASLPVCSMATITAVLKELSWPGELTKFPNSSLPWEVPI